MLLDTPPKEGKHYRYCNLEFWAQGGVICIEDMKDETETRFRAISLSEFLERAANVKMALRYIDYKYADERVRDENFIKDAVQCAKEAMNQGDPFDPKVIEHYHRHRRRNFSSGVSTENTPTRGVFPAETMPELNKLLPPLGVGSSGDKDDAS